MSDRKPIVYDGLGQLEQLQSGDDLDIPLQQQVDCLKMKFKLLCELLVAQGFELPDELLSI